MAEGPEAVLSSPENLTPSLISFNLRELSEKQLFSLFKPSFVFLSENPTGEVKFEEPLRFPPSELPKVYFSGKIV